MDGVVFIDDVSLKSSLVERWIPFTLKNMKKKTNVLLVGNKADKRKEDCVEAVR